MRDLSLVFFVRITKLPSLFAARLSSLSCQRPLALRRRRTGARPLPISIHPRLLLSLSSPALVPCQSASALACLRHHRHWLSSLACQRPPSPAIVVAATAPAAAILLPPLPAVVVAAAAPAATVPLLPSPSRQPLLSSTATIIDATKPSSAPKSPQKPTKAPRKHYFQRNPYRKKTEKA